jgi:thiamine-phosphate pyrophosphorylase
MTRRQSLPQQWLIVDHGLSGAAWTTIGRLPRGSGVLVIGALAAKDGRRLRVIAGRRQLTIVLEDRRTAARVHNQRELTRALLQRAHLILVSPVHPTRSHPDWKPMPRMRAAALAGLAQRHAFALGGMDARRYANVAQLGFIGWAGISAFRT